MAIARVAGSHAENRWTFSASARTINFGGALTVGSLLVVRVATFTSGITVTVSDSVNGAYTQAGAYAVNSSSRASVFYFENNGSNGTPTVTITPSAGVYLSVSIDEYTGAKASAALRASAESTGAAFACVVGPAGSAGTDLVVAVVSAGGTSPCTGVDAPFTLITNLHSSISLQTIYTADDANAPGDESCTFNGSGASGAWAGKIAAFEAAAVSATRLMAGFVTDVMILREHVRVPYGEM